MKMEMNTFFSTIKNAFLQSDVDLDIKIHLNNFELENFAFDNLSLQASIYNEALDTAHGYKAYLKIEGDFLYDDVYRYYDNDNYNCQDYNCQDWQYMHNYQHYDIKNFEITANNFDLSFFDYLVELLGGCGFVLSMLATSSYDCESDEDDNIKKDICYKCKRY